MIFAPSLIAMLAVAAPPAASLAPAPAIELVQPLTGSTLVGGDTAAVEWSGEVRGAEEWEAFLSLDGGRTWTQRITPHLDLVERRMSWRVPDVTAADARILLRFGDERREVGIELPQRFAIAPSTSGATLTLPALRLGRGEPVRAGARGVVAWVEGSRRGAALRQVATIDPLASLRVAPSAYQAGALAPGVLPTLPALLPPAPTRAGPEPRAGERRAPASRPGAAFADILLLIQRQNE